MTIVRLRLHKKRSDNNATLVPCCCVYAIYAELVVKVHSTKVATKKIVLLRIEPLNFN